MKMVLIVALLLLLPQAWGQTLKASSSVQYASFAACPSNRCRDDLSGFTTHSYPKLAHRLAWRDGIHVKPPVTTEAIIAAIIAAGWDLTSVSESPGGWVIYNFQKD